MSFLQNLFRQEKRAESVAFIDLAADSVAGAYARYEEGKPPVLLYTRRLPIEAREGEPPEAAMLRALRVLGDALVREGAPVLLRFTGSGSAGTVLVSADTPWQETTVRTERFERIESFTFTRSMVAEALEKTRAVPAGKKLVNESIIGTILNGYETRSPYGKKVHRAAVVVLSSCINEKIAEAITAALRGLFHSENSIFIAGDALRYQAMRAAFPHEREALILDATGPFVSISLVRRGLFVALSEVADASARSWMDVVMGECAALAKQYPLPRTIFLLTRESEADALRQQLSAVNFGAIWPSDNPPTIVSVLASHLVGLVQQATAVPPDLEFILMALFYQQRTLETNI